MPSVVKTFSRLMAYFSKRGAGLSVLAALLLSSVCSLAQATGVSGCLPGEGVFFSCRLPDHRIVSLCTAPKAPPFGSITYRYGTEDKTEVTYRASVDNQNRFLGTVSAVSPKATVRQVWFEQDGGKYIATSCVGGDCPHRGGLIVFRKGQLEMSQACASGVGGHPWFSSEVVRFGSSLDGSKSNTGLVQLQDFDNNVNVLYPVKGVD